MNSENYQIVTVQEEQGFKKVFNSNIPPKEWVVLNGHRVLSGDFRNHSFPDKDFERWIHEVYRLLHNSKQK